MGSELTAFVSSGGGFERYRSSRVGEAYMERQEVSLGGKPATINLFLLYDTAKEAWLFPRPGRYKIFVEYKNTTRGLIRSNVASIDVEAPEGFEAEVFRRAQRLGWMFLGVPDGEPLTPKVAALVEEFPDSVYLHRLRIGDLRYHAGENTPPTELPGFIDLARELSSIKSPYTPAALLTLAELQMRVQDVVQAEETLVQLKRDYPNVAEADAATKLLAEIAARKVD